MILIGVSEISSKFPKFILLLIELLNNILESEFDTVTRSDILVNSSFFNEMTIFEV